MDEKQSQNPICATVRGALATAPVLVFAAHSVLFLWPGAHSHLHSSPNQLLQCSVYMLSGNMKPAAQSPADVQFGKFASLSEQCSLKRPESLAAKLQQHAFRRLYIPLHSLAFEVFFYLNWSTVFGFWSFSRLKILFKLRIFYVHF